MRIRGIGFDWLRWVDEADPMRRYDPIEPWSPADDSELSFDRIRELIKGDAAVARETRRLLFIARRSIR